MDRMPISNGKDRSNYTTSTNFTVVRRIADPSMGQNSMVAHRDPVRHQINRHLAAQDSPRMPLDSSYVFIPDQRLREIVQKLVISEQDRIANNIDPNLMTQINHRGYSLFFSRTGINPFSQQQQQQQEQQEQQQQKIVSPDQNFSTTAQEQSGESSQNVQKNESTDLASEASTARNNLITISQVNEQQNSVYTERAPTMMFNQIAPIGDEIPPEVNRAIQEDLASNPLYGTERSYKIVLKNKISGGEPKVLRVIVKSQNYQKLPQIQKPKYVIQPKSQYVQYIESDDLTSNEPIVTLTRRSSKNASNQNGFK